ncbi:MAG: phosphoglucosamine mutase [Candidatus Nomurabacteria bacterium]|nr:phosphoglucosamine mutase [Candidatus Nomurabacteria bacterium]
MAKLNVSGYRGIWGKDLNEQIAYEFGLAFAKLIKKHPLPASPLANGEEQKHKILIGRDARKTGPLMFSAFKQACEKEGVQFEYAGIIPTPSMLLLIRKLGFSGGIMITASHNPPEYNGIKFMNDKGLFLTPSQIEEIIKNKDSLSSEEKVGVRFTTQDNPMGSEIDNQKFRKIHIDEILKNIDVEKIKSKKFKVAHDPINSAGSIITLELLESLGCEVFQINKEQTGEFTHMPEPTVQNLEQIAQAVKDNNADIGFAQDPDADRLVMVNEKGEIIFEEYTVVVGVKSALMKESRLSVPIKDVVVNMSTTKICEDLATEYKTKLYRTKVGEPNVVNKMLEVNALVGGEGSGGIIYPRINPARDSLVGMALTLELMATENKKISEIVNELPKYFTQKDKIGLKHDLPIVYEKLKQKFPDGKIDTLDGIRFDFADNSWVHLRPSNTEPIVRMIGEAKDEKRIQSLLEQVRLTLDQQ